MASPAVSTQFGVSWTALLLTGWAVAIVLILVGHLRKIPALFGGGLVAAGLMVFLTPFSFFLYVALRNGTIDMGPEDIVLLGVFAFLGGVVAAFGFPHFRPNIRSSGDPISGRRK